MCHAIPVRCCLLLASIVLTGCGDRAPAAADSAAADSAAAATHSAGATPAAPQTADSTATTQVESLMRRVYDGFVSHDAAAINAAVPAAGMAYVGPDGMMLVSSPDGTSEMVKQCVVQRYAMDSVRTSAPAPGLALLTFKLTIDETCGGQRTPSPLYVMSTWQRRESTWQAIAFSATPATGAR